MKKLVVLLLFSVGSAHGALIDFEEVAPFIVSNQHISVISQGYTFTTSGDVFVLDAGVSAAGIYSNTFGAAGPGSDGFATSVIEMRRDDGNPFAIFALTAVASQPQNSAFSGQLAQTGDWVELTEAIGTGNWLNLQAFAFSESGQELQQFQLRLDDIHVNVVPIPAAVSLFGSAILMLGALRRPGGK